ncbi:MAG: ATPase [Anaerovoracaceae bacterium]|jgi:hypothetical protein|nr:ATPase [Anaerovoracaceae bacterium]
MKVLELLEEIEDVVDTAASVPLTGKIMIDANELLEIVKEIRIELPDEIQQAQWIKGERERILNEAKQEYEAVLRDAMKQAESLIENDDITMKAKQRAEEIMTITTENCRNLKLESYNYIDKILFNFQQKMDQMNGEYFLKMFENMENTFNKVNETLVANREEIEELAHKAQMENK